MKKHKKDLYPANVSFDEAAKMDKAKLNRVKSPDVSRKKYRQDIPELRMVVFADKKRILDRMVEGVNEGVNEGVINIDSKVNKL
jgi:hypothetical protein